MSEARKRGKQRCAECSSNVLLQATVHIKTPLREREGGDSPSTDDIRWSQAKFSRRIERADSCRFSSNKTGVRSRTNERTPNNAVTGQINARIGRVLGGLLHGLCKHRRVTRVHVVYTRPSLHRTCTGSNTYYHGDR